MARSISVKIPTALLIAEIEAKIASIDASVESYADDLKEYEVAKEKYRIDLAVAISKVMLNKDTIGYDYDAPIRLVTYGDSRIQLEFKPSAVAGLPEMPQEPQEPNRKTWYGREYYSPKEMLQKNLKVLRMTSQEEVSGSTYGALIEFL
jgi:hypothetical protein